MASYSKKIAKNIQKSRLKCLLLILFSHWFVRMGLWNRMNGKSTKTRSRRSTHKKITSQARIAEEQLLEGLNESEVYDYMLSKLNFCQRKQMYSSLEAKVYVKVGDICFTDFGLAYLSEVGYQHFGLVLAMKNGKIFVVPMSGNSSAYHRAYDPVSHMGKRHLMRLPEIEGLNKASVLFLNDAKWINSARVIDVKAHIDPNSHLFDKIKKCVMQMML